MKPDRILYIAQPHGMCAGVRRALETVERTLRSAGEPVYVLHELVHNRTLVESLARRGVRFASSLDAVPDGAVLLFSAHGVALAVERRAAEKHLKLIDATCPLVRALQVAAARASAAGEVLVLIGHRNHPEVEGIVGRTDGREVFVVENEAEAAALPEFPGRNLRLLSQTTMNTEQVDELTVRLRRKYPGLRCGPGVCYATRNRQAAVRLLAAKTRLVLVIGSEKSSNTGRLREIAEESGARAFRIENAEELPLSELAGAESVGLTAGASAPEELFDAAVRRLCELGFTREQTLEAARETGEFPLPALN